MPASNSHPAVAPHVPVATATDFLSVFVCSVLHRRTRDDSPPSGHALALTGFGYAACEQVHFGCGGYRRVAVPRRTGSRCDCGRRAASGGEGRTAATSDR